MANESVRVNTGVIIDNGVQIETKAASGGVERKNKALEITIGTTKYRIPITTSADSWKLGATCHACHSKCHSNCHGSCRGAW